LGGKREIKCPNCKEWTLWRGELYDRCLYCGEFLQNEDYSKKIEHEIRTKVKEENDLFYIKPTDSNFTKKSKKFFRKFRKVILIGQAVLIGFMSFLLWIIGLLST
jgi:hypothetical protein